MRPTRPLVLAALAGLALAAAACRRDEPSPTFVPGAPALEESGTGGTPPTPPPTPDPNDTTKTTSGMIGSGS